VKRSLARLISEERGIAKKVTEQLAADGRLQRRYLDTFLIVVGRTGYLATQSVLYGIVDWAESCGITESECLGRMQVGRTAFVVRDPGDGGPDPVWFRRVTSGDSERDLDILHPEEMWTSGCLLPGAREFGIAAESKDFEWTSREDKYGSFTREERQFFGMRPGETIRVEEPPRPGF
jgi:(2Fe-2S) ferredoxin